MPLITNSEKQFVCFYDEFEPDKHFIELADRRCSNKLATAKGTAKFTVLDSNGISRNITLQNALLAQTFPTNLFSVSAATDNGAEVKFKNGAEQLISARTTFNFERQGLLYSLQNDRTMASVPKTLQEWHTTVDHMNYDDIL